MIFYVIVIFYFFKLFHQYLLSTYCKLVPAIVPHTVGNEHM
jgi:hypothetical protein